MSAKLYRVRVTEIRFGGPIDIHDRWVAAISRKQAEQRALESMFGLVSRDRLHVHVDCWRGGVSYNNSLRLQKTTP